MKQKIVIKVQFGNNCVKCATVYCDKCRRKALKIAAGAQGVGSVSLEGEDRDQVVVVGQKVDSVCLANVLRKKFSCAEIKSVEEVKEENKDDGGKKDKNKVETKPTKELPPLPLPPLPLPPCCHVHCPPCVIYEHDPYGSDCIIM